MRELLEFCLAVIAIVISYKFGQKTAWDEITRNYIAIHKTAVIGPILIKNNGGYNHVDKNNKSNRTYKKAFTQKKKHN